KRTRFCVLFSFIVYIDIMLKFHFNPDTIAVGNNKVFCGRFYDKSGIIFNFLHLEFPETFITNPAPIPANPIINGIGLPFASAFWFTSFTVWLEDEDKFRIPPTRKQAPPPTRNPVPN